jgi:hypothetical protein
MFKNGLLFVRSVALRRSGFKEIRNIPIEPLGFIVSTGIAKSFEIASVAGVSRHDCKILIGNPNTGFLSLTLK